MSDKVDEERVERSKKKRKKERSVTDVPRPSAKKWTKVFVILAAFAASRSEKRWLMCE